MLDHQIREAILTLARQGRGVRAIARAVGVDRKSVRKVLAQGVPDVPDLDRPGQLDAWLSQIRDLHAICKGNLVRVHEELQARHGVEGARSPRVGLVRAAFRFEAFDDRPRAGC